ncbi:hypothetical protein P8610_16800 [Fictibacillus sp. UD]|uniref:hypothetical protein n=1 Tax=Fictibacillus sp. UD TaxID=3038777 RepID=UPI0037477630
MNFLKFIITFALMISIINFSSHPKSVEAATGKEVTKYFVVQKTLKNYEGKGWDHTYFKSGWITINGYDLLGHKNAVDVTIKINDSWVNAFQYGRFKGTWKDDESMSIGNYKDPVEIKMSTSGQLINKKMDRDYFYTQQWWGNFDQRYKNTKATLGVGYGPIGVAVEPTASYNIDPRSKKTLYLGGEKYPTLTTFTFPNTTMYKRNHYYTARTEIGVLSTANKKSSKFINVKVELPVYLGNTKVSTQTLTLSLPYKSGR